jgi:hypothetical protein
MECIFKRVRRPTSFKVQKVHEINLLFRESRRFSEELFLREFSMRGMPIYLDGREHLLKLRIQFIWD